MKRSAHHFPRHLHPSTTFKNSTPFISRPRNPPLLTPRPCSRQDRTHAKTPRRKGLCIGSLRETGLVGCSEAVGRLLSKPQRHPKSKHLIHHVHPSTAQPTTALPVRTYIFSSFLCVFASLREPFCTLVSTCPGLSPQPQPYSRPYPMSSESNHRVPL